MSFNIFIQDQLNRMVKGERQVLLEPTIVAAASGILSHLLFFIHGIRDLQALGIIFAFSAIQCILLTLVSKDVLAYVDIAYFIGLYSSIVTYRLFFHRLRAFPGPFAAKMSKTFYGLYMSRNGAYSKELQKLHEKYGDVVRIGKNFQLFLSSSPDLSVDRYRISTKAQMNCP